MIMGMKTKLNELWTLRHNMTSAIQKVKPFPDMVGYGHMYSISLFGEGVSRVETFYFNPQTYGSSGMHDVLNRLFADLIPDLRYVEFSARGLDQLLVAGGEEALPAGITHNNGHFTIKGSALRYSVKKKLPKREAYGISWSPVPDTFILTVNPIKVWDDENVDKTNHERLLDWLDEADKGLVAAQTYLKAIREKITSAE